MSLTENAPPSQQLSLLLGLNTVESAPDDGDDDDGDHVLFFPPSSVIVKVLHNSLL